MRVSKNSWHYKVVLASVGQRERRVPDDVCRYLRMLVLMLTVYTGAAFIMLWFAVSVVYTWYAVLFGVMPQQEQQWAMVLVVTGAVVSVCAAGTLVALTLRWASSRMSKGVDKQPSLIVEYARAKKQKICPRVDFED